MTNTMKQLRSINWRSGLFVLSAAFFVVPLAAYAGGDDCFPGDPLRPDPPAPFRQCRTISGKVTDPAGNGIAGVAVKIERFGAEVDQIFTNAAGNYTSDPLFRNVSPVYVVTPRNSWYRFVPPSQPVALPNNVSSINFKGILREKRADFDSDGKTDISVFGRVSGYWSVRRSSDLQYDSFQFGQNGDILTPGDFNGDRKTDAAVFRPSNGTWYIRLPGFGAQFGIAGDEPVQADYDGDGKTDIAVFRPSNGTWYILRPSTVDSVQFGLAGDLPVAGDYDGDGKTDIAVFRRSDLTWYIRRLDGSFYGVPFGIKGDRPVQADYDGDGNTNIAVFRPSDRTWYIRRLDGSFYGVPFGIETDLSVPGDYDGDGKADVAVKRIDGTWYILKSTDGSVIQVNFTNEYPAPRAYLHPIYD